METRLSQLNQRVYKLERHNEEEILTLLEILSNATFFGDMKKESCEYAKDGQCGFFILSVKAKNRIPIVTECRIKDCGEHSLHCHIELSDVTCAFCQRLNVGKNDPQPEETSNKIEGNQLRK